MMIVMREDATEKDVSEVVSRVESTGARAHVIQGESQTVIGAVGDVELVRDLSLEVAPGVDHTMPISRPYKLASSQVISSYDWVWAPVSCGPCEAVGELPTYDMKGKALPVRFGEAAFYEYPKGFFRALGKGLRIFSPDALLGNSFKLKPKDGGYFSDWHALGTPEITAKLEPK